MARSLDLRLRLGTGVPAPSSVSRGHLMDIYGRSLIWVRCEPRLGVSCGISGPTAWRWADDGSMIVRIDPGGYGHGVIVLGPDGEEALRERVANEAAAIEALVDRVVELAGPGRARWVIEADGCDGVVLIGELLAREELVAALTPTEVAMRRKGRRQVHRG
jgi:hypothetical protein